MNAIDNILTRNSPIKLIEPYPDQKQMEIIYKAAFRAPDHAWLRPSRFIQISGDGINKLSEIFYSYCKNNIKNISEEKLKKYKNAPFRAPMIIVLISNITEHPSVPEHEQMFSTAAAAQNILLALHALNFGGIWRTGIFAMNPDIERALGLNKNQKILGYLYVGTPTGKIKKIPSVEIKKFVTKLD
jgi:nitroreductase